MKKTKAWLIVSALLIVLGLSMFSVAMTALDWDFLALDQKVFEENTYDITEPFNSIVITDDTADIEIIPADNDFRVVCFESERARHSAAIKNGVLTISLTDNQNWTDFIGISFRSPKISVFVPKAEYESISVSVSTGDISVEGINARELSLSVSTGDVFLTSVAAEKIDSAGSTGNVSLKRVSVSDALFVKRSTGNVRFEESDAADILVETDTGDVYGTLLSEKVFDVHTDTGSVSVPKTSSGGSCKITTDTGNVRLKIKE